MSVVGIILLRSGSTTWWMKAYKTESLKQTHSPSREFLCVKHVNWKLLMCLMYQIWNTDFFFLKSLGENQMLYVLLIMSSFSIFKFPGSVSCKQFVCWRWQLDVPTAWCLLSHVLYLTVHSLAFSLSYRKHIPLVLMLLELTTARNGCKVVATPLPLLSYMISQEHHNKVERVIWYEFIGSYNFKMTVPSW